MRKNPAFPGNFPSLRPSWGWGWGGASQEVCRPSESGGGERSRMKGCPGITTLAILLRTAQHPAGTARSRRSALSRQWLPRLLLASFVGTSASAASMPAQIAYRRPARGDRREARGAGGRMRQVCDFSVTLESIVGKDRKGEPGPLRPAQNRAPKSSGRGVSGPGPAGLQRSRPESSSLRGPGPAPGRWAFPPR